MEHIEFTYTGGMDEETVEAYLDDHQFGVLSLAKDSEAYGIPVAYHRWDGSLLLRLGEHEGSKKVAFIESTDTACFVIYGADPPEESWSILITGTIEPLPDEEAAALDEAILNRLFVPLRVFDEPIDDLETGLYRLTMDEITGRSAVD